MHLQTSFVSSTLIFFLYFKAIYEWMWLDLTESRFFPIDFVQFLQQRWWDRYSYKMAQLLPGFWSLSWSLVENDILWCHVRRESLPVPKKINKNLISYHKFLLVVLNNLSLDVSAGKWESSSTPNKYNGHFYR